VCGCETNSFAQDKDYAPAFVNRATSLQFHKRQGLYLRADCLVEYQRLKKGGIPQSYSVFWSWKVVEKRNSV